MNISDPIFLTSLLTVLVGYIIYLFVKINTINKRHQKLHTDFKILETKINSVELEDLKYKINPHLFKNILKNP